MKTCTGCGQAKPLTAFGVYARSPDGRKPACRECRKRGLPPEIRAQTGLSAAERASLDAAAKTAAFRFVSAAKTRSAAEVARITGPMTREGLIALALNLAEAVTDGHRLLAVTRAVDDGLPAVTLAAPARSQVPAGDTPRTLTVALSDEREAAADAA